MMNFTLFSLCLALRESDKMICSIAWENCILKNDATPSDLYTGRRFEKSSSILTMSNLHCYDCLYLDFFYYKHKKVI